MEAEKQRLDDELTRAQRKISVSEKAVASLTTVEPVINDYYNYILFKNNFELNYDNFCDIYL